MTAALALGSVDGLEFDVRLSRDGVPVLLHDETLARTHGRPERPSDLDVDALRTVGVPSLEEVLAAAPDDAFLDVELKEDAAAPVAAALAPRVARGARLAVSSFVPEQLIAFAAVAPGIERWLNAERLDEEAVATARRLGCAAVSARLTTIDEATFALTVRAGLQVAAWTARTRAEVERLASLGVSAVCVEHEAIAV